MVAANRMVAPLMASAAPDLRTAPVNVIRLTLHPQGLAPRIVNFSEWRTHLLERLRRDVEITANSKLRDLLAEAHAYPTPQGARLKQPANDFTGIAVPFQFSSPAGTLSFYSTTTVFGTPVDVTLSELMLETFFPADETTADYVRGLADNPARQT